MPESEHKLESSSLWKNTDFLKLWAARTAASFGALMGALSLVAVLVLDARPAQMAILGMSGTAPALLFGLVAGVWVDRVRRRPLLVMADAGRAVALASIPVAFLLDGLHMEHLYAVALVVGALAIFFDAAHPSYTPSVVGRANLVEANSKLTAAESVVEVGAFSVSGWIAQILSAIVATAVNAFTFLASGVVLLLIRRREPPPQIPQGVRNVRKEVIDGIRFVWREPLLRAIGFSQACGGFGGGAIGGMITLFAISEVGFEPGPLGMIYAAGGISSFLGAVVAARVTGRFGIGPSMAWGLVLFGSVGFLIPLAPQPLWVAAAFFLLPQLIGDGAWTVHGINEISLRQAITPDHIRGRVNSAINFMRLASQLLGAAAAGVVAELAGLRWALVMGFAVQLMAGMVLLLSPVRHVIRTPDEAETQV